MRLFVSVLNVLGGVRTACVDEMSANCLRIAGLKGGMHFKQAVNLPSWTPVLLRVRDLWKR